MAVARCAVRMGAGFEGPRPPSVKWPHAREGSRAPSGRWRQPKEKRVPQSIPPPLRQASRAPEVVAADTALEVSRFENAIQVLGETNPHAQCLVEALRVARAKTTPCKDDSASSPGEDQFVQDLANVPGNVWHEPKRLPGRWSRRKFTSGRFRADGPPSVKEIPPMPTDHQDLQGGSASALRSQERSRVLGPCHYREGGVSSFAGHSTQLASGSWDVPMDGSTTTRSALMASLIEESDAKRRAVQGTINALPSMVGNQV